MRGHLLLRSLVKTRNFVHPHRHGWAGQIRFTQSTVYGLDINEYTKALYDKLCTREPYQFLDQDIHKHEDSKLSSSTEFNDFLRILASSEENCSHDKLVEIQQSFSDKFLEWTRVSQLRVGFLMYLDRRVSSDEYLDKIIRHIASGNLCQASPHDLIALLLLIYFRRSLTVEDLSEFMDLQQLQTVLTTHIKEGRLSMEEVCAACLGFKRISGLKVNYKPLREEIYGLLEGFKSSNDKKLDSFLVLTLLTTLSKGNLTFQDDVNLVAKMLSGIAIKSQYLEFDTQIRLLTFPMSLGFVNDKIEDQIVRQFEDNLEKLDTRDVLSLSNYVSKRSTLKTSLATSLLNHLEESMDKISNFDELVDIIDSFHYLTHRSIYSQKCNNLLFDALNHVQSSDDKLDIEHVSKSVGQYIMDQLNVTERTNISESSEGKNLSIFTRIPAFMYLSQIVDLGIDSNKVDKTFLRNLFSLFHKRLPIELYSPQLDVKKLEFRTKQLVIVYRAMVKFMGNEQHVKAARILPHFEQPDIIFGNIGGMNMSVPHYITDPGYVGLKKPPPGDWWVLVVGSRKSQDLQGNIIGQEAAKVSQLKKLGYTPVVLLYKDIGNPSQIMQAIARVLKSSDVTLPNIDDGIHEHTRRF